MTLFVYLFTFYALGLGPGRTGGWFRKEETVDDSGP